MNPYVEADEEVWEIHRKIMDRYPELSSREAMDMAVKEYESYFYDDDRDE